jgi:hypothetical protein
MSNDSSSLTNAAIDTTRLFPHLEGHEIWSVINKTYPPLHSYAALESVEEYLKESPPSKLFPNRGAAWTAFPELTLAERKSIREHLPRNFFLRVLGPFEVWMTATPDWASQFVSQFRVKILEEASVTGKSANECTIKIERLSWINFEYSITDPNTDFCRSGYLYLFQMEEFWHESETGETSQQREQRQAQIQRLADFQAKRIQFLADLEAQEQAEVQAKADRIALMEELVELTAFL